MWDKVPQVGNLYIISVIFSYFRTKIAMYFNSCSDGLVLLVKGVMHSLFLRGGGGGVVT